MKRFSKNAKLNGLLNEIYDDLEKLGADEVKRYKKDFYKEIDYNIVNYGNLLIYYYDVRQLYKRHNYKSIEKMNDQKLWDIYRRQVGYVARFYF